MGELLTEDMFTLAQNSVLKRCRALQDELSELRRRALTHLTMARNMEAENAHSALAEKQLAHIVMGNVAVRTRQLDALHMQAAFFRAKRTPRVCEVRVARFVPPWVVWHLPRRTVEYLAKMCEDIRVKRGANEDERSYQMRCVARAHELVAREIDLRAPPNYKPNKFVTKADVQFMRSFARKMLNSKSDVDAAYNRFMARIETSKKQKLNEQ